MGSDRRRNLIPAWENDFNPRSPDGERLATFWRKPFICGFQSTLPGWGATGSAFWVEPLLMISIHAPRMGSDEGAGRIGPGPHDFNPRSPDGERPKSAYIAKTMFRFQSTLPGWGATIHYPYRANTIPISIHAPRMGSDDATPLITPSFAEFQSTLPGWGATLDAHDGAHEGGISIHAPRMGSDQVSSMVQSALLYFNPRSPDGERQIPLSTLKRRLLFQSTLPGWGATAKMDIFAHDMGKIIHFQH